MKEDLLVFIFPACIMEDEGRSLMSCGETRRQDRKERTKVSAAGGMFANTALK